MTTQLADQDVAILRPATRDRHAYLLRFYGKHRGHCSTQTAGANRGCTCGFDQALDEVSGRIQAEPIF